MRRSPLLVLLVALMCSGASVSSAMADNPVAPKATTGAASAIGETAATVAGTVDPEGAATTYAFEYGTTVSYGLTTPVQDVGTGTDPVAVGAALSKLTSDTTYHYRVVATNAAGVTRGADRTLRTAKVPRAPTVSTGAAKGVGPAAAALTGTVDPRGPSTTVSVEYGTSTKYGLKGPQTVIEGFGSRAVSLPVGGLTPYTKYYYRLVATNEKGTTRGSSRSFTTLRAPTTVELTSVPTAIGWGGSATVAGRVVGAGVSRIGVQVERSDFPFSGNTTKNVTTASDGTFQTSIGPVWVTTRLRVVTRTTLVATSRTATVYNRLRVGIRAAGKTRRTVTFSGTAQPGLGVARVSVQRRSIDGGRWVRVAGTSVKAGNAYTSRYRVRVTRTRRASWFRAVVVPSDGGAHASGTSRELRISGRARR